MATTGFLKPFAMQTDYYIIINDRQAGPFSREALRSQNLRPDSLVWRTGLPDWIKASELPELADLLAEETHYEDISSGDASRWFAMINGQQVGPYTIETLLSMGLKPDTPVWRAGMSDWADASSQPEIAQYLGSTPPPHGNAFGQNPQYGPNAGYGRNSGYGPGNSYGPNTQYGPNQGFGKNPQYDTNYNYGGNGFGFNNGNRNYNYNRQNPGGPAPVRTNWLPWAIVATVASFLCSCIGCIFGIIAIVNANKANNLYEAGYDEMGDQANNTAKIMTIISLVIAGIGLVINGWTIKNMLF